MSKRKSTAKLKFRKNLFYDVIFKNTILDQFTHLTKYVVSCLESVDDNANDVSANGGLVLTEVVDSIDHSQLLFALFQTAEKPCGIIYCKNRKTVDVVAKTLTEQGVLTKAHHGGIEDRDKVQAEWMAGALPVIAATTSFGGGIAKATVRFVVHWNVPRSVAKYYRVSVELTKKFFFLSFRLLNDKFYDHRNLAWLAVMDNCRTAGFTTAKRMPRLSSPL